MEKLLIFVKYLVRLLNFLLALFADFINSISFLVEINGTYMIVL